MSEIENEHKNAFASTCLEVERDVQMAWHLPPPPPPPFMKQIIVLFVSVLYMLQHYDWEKDTIDIFKSKLPQYRQFKNGKWEDWVEDIFMSSYRSSWSFVEFVCKTNLQACDFISMFSYFLNFKLRIEVITLQP